MLLNEFSRCKRGRHYSKKTGILLVVHVVWMDFLVFYVAENVVSFNSWSS